MDASGDTLTIDADQATLDAITWAICPHISRWSDPNWHEYASQHQICNRCPESETIEGHEVTCPSRGDAETAAKAVLNALACKRKASRDA